jgi:predicted ATPase
MPKLEKISISGFKNLKNFEVTELKKINYFIGASGAGKSSVFELLTMLFRGSWQGGGSHFGDLTKVIPDECKVSVVVNDGVTLRTIHYLARAQSKDSLTVHEEKDPSNDYRVDMQYFSAEQKDYGYTDDRKKRISSYDPTTFASPVEEAINSIADKNPDGFATFKVVRSHRGNSDAEPLILSGRERSEEMSTSNLAGGYSALVSLLATVYNNRGGVILVLEEPENGMHITQQKLIHEWLKELTADFDDLQIMVITHSPFLLASINENDTDTNTYLINDGSALRPNGYSAKGARYLASKLVGFSFEDIAPSKIVVCEGSLRALLGSVNDRFYNSPIMFASARSRMGGEASGDDDILDLAAVQQVYDNRFNFYDKARLIFVIDSPNDSQKKIQEKVNQLKQTSDTELIVLSKQAIENYYPEIDNLEKSVSDQIIDEHNSKKERATAVGVNISKDQFEKVFKELIHIFE